MIGEIPVLNIIIITLLCAFTSFLSHMGMAVFQDGIRPIVPECTEGRMKRSELTSIAFGLSVGFIVSVGLAHTFSTGILNPWLLFLTTDILGIAAKKKWIAPIYGGLWGALMVVSMSLIQTGFAQLPVDIIGSLDLLRAPIIFGFGLFPLVAIFTQFGAKKGAIASVITLAIRQIIVTYAVADVAIYIQSIQVLIGVFFLILFAIIKDRKNTVEVNEEELNLFTEKIKRIRKNVIWLMIGGGLIATACNLGIFAGSDVSIYILSEAQKANNSEVANIFIRQASLAEFMRALGFVPLIVTAAITTGVYGIAGLTFLYPIGYLMPNPILAAIGGALMILFEVFSLRMLWKVLGKYPSIRTCADNIRSSITTVMEFALIIGSMSAIIKMGGEIGFFIGALFYFVNELTGKKIMRIAIGPLSVIATGVILNILHLVGLYG